MYFGRVCFWQCIKVVLGTVSQFSALLYFENFRIFFRIFFRAILPAHPTTRIDERRSRTDLLLVIFLTVLRRKIVVKFKKVIWCL